MKGRTPQNLLIMPGGSSKDEYLSLGDEGMEKIRLFIRNGGGYFLGGKLGFTSAATKDIFKDYLDHGGKAIVHKRGVDILAEVAEVLK